MIKKNCRPVSFLSHMCKVFEIMIFNLINELIEPFSSNLLTGFRKNRNTQYCLLKMLEKWNEALDKGNFVASVFMDISKAFDILNHDLPWSSMDLLMAKPEACGLSINSLK